MKQNIDWRNLGFSYLPTNCHVRYVWRDGQWDQGELVEEPYLRVHIAATALHYGQAAFEGLKAFRCRDGKVRLFRPHENARRLANTAERICMAQVPEGMFLDAVQRVVDANRDYVPPYGTGGSLYVRPLLFGSGPQIGVNPAEEYVFLVLVLPVGPYYKGGLQPVRAVILDEYDRAAPRGVGNVKVAGNYAASLEPHQKAAAMGFPVELYLDSRERKYVDEFGTSNFIAVTRDGTYVTPESPSVLPSITNMSLQQIARDMDMKVEKRPVELAEVASFAEVGACGTAVVVTPVYEIVHDGEIIRISEPDRCGPTLQAFYDRMTAIQYGEVDDKHGWTLPV